MVQIHIILLTCLIAISFAKLSLILNETNTEQEFIVNSLNNWTKKDDSLTIIFYEEYRDMLWMPLNKVALLINISKMLLSEHHILKYYYNYVIIIKCNKLQNTLDYIKESYIWNYGSTVRGNYIFFLFDCVNVTESFNIIWKSHNVQEAIVFIKNNLNWITYNYNPIIKESKCGKSIQPVIIKSRKEMQSSTYLEHCIFNISKLNLYLPPSYFNNPGGTPILFGIFLLLKQRYKLNFAHFDMPVEHQMGLGEYDSFNFLKEMINGEFDAIAANIFRQDINRITEINTCEFTDVFFFDNHVWYLPSVKKIPEIKLLIIIFAWDVLCTIVLSTLIAFLFWYFVSIIKLEDNYMTELLGCILGFSIKIPKSRIFKFLFIFYTFYGQHINYFFQGNLNSKLTVPQYERRIKTIEQLIDSNLILLLPDYERFLLSNSTIPLLNKLYNRSITMKTLVAKLTFIKENQSAAITSFLSSTNYTLAYKDYVDTLIDSDLNQISPQLFLRSGHPLLPLINKMIRKSNEYGFFIKWFSNRNATFFPNDVSRQNKITTKHLESIFLCYFVGMLIGSVILIAEILHVHLKKRMKRNAY